MGFYAAVFVLVIYIVSRFFLVRDNHRKEYYENIICHQKKELRKMEETVRRLERPRYYREVSLTPAERELLDSIRNNRTTNTKELAQRMFRAESTIGNSIYNIRKKLNLASRAELYAYVMMCIPEETEQDCG